MTTTMATLQEWLEAAKCYDVVEVEVTIGQKAYTGCRYKQGRVAPPGSRAGQEGRGEYVQEALYLLGKTPSSFERSRRTVYVIDGEEHEWYVASWATKATAESPAYADMHYQGNAHFQLMPWSHGKIDDGETHEYKRIPATLRMR